MSRNVLVVEDDSLVRLTVCHYLEGMGWKVTEVASGSAALDVFGDSTVNVDAVLADIHLPDMDGAELAMRSQSDCPFIFMSGALVARPDLPGPLLLKPFNAKKLASALVNAWQEHHHL